MSLGFFSRRVKKKEIARLYFTENLLLGAGAFLVGMGLGLLFQQILLSIFYSMVQLDYKLHLEWNRNCILMTAACYLCCYLLALFRSQKKFRKMNIHDLMDSQRQNEEIKETHEKAKRWFLPLSVLFLVVFGVFLFCFKAWDKPMEEKIMHLLITEDDMALAQGLQRALQEKNRQVLCCKNIQETRLRLCYGNCRINRICVITDSDVAVDMDTYFIVFGSVFVDAFDTKIRIDDFEV